MRPRRQRTSTATRVFSILALLVILSMILGLFVPVTLGR
jgi:hypothetical protein